MDDVFKALADPTRRALLDDLFARDGQTLSGLTKAHAPMSRFGVAKHLGVLEGAGLVVARKAGREKRHFLNAVPIRQIQDRWIGKYQAPVAAMLTDLKHRLEAPMVQAGKALSWSDGSAPVAGDTAVFEIYIKTTAERLWEAITDPDQRALYSFGARTESDWTEGSEYRAAAGPDGAYEIAGGTNLEVVPPRRLVQTFEARWGDDVRAQGETRVTWEIEPVGTSCRLTVVHDRLPANANAQLYGGWPMILSGLKTYLETGESLDTPGSLQYAG